MATMSVRTTVSFDPGSAARLERLAKHWGVSKSETLRRALEQAERSQPASAAGAPDFESMDPRQAFEWLQANPQVPAGWGEGFRRELSTQDDRDGEIEEEREQTRAGLKAQIDGTAS